MSTVRSIWDHPYTFWALLSLPAVPMALGLTSGDPKAIHNLLHPTGEFAARFMIFAMMVTEVVLLFRTVLRLG
ncbi:hypothetical protein [Sulfitobacter sp.]|uniref:hypothetical protein n=1 Tax=Sulfitobacter sp. TaxID=1903071 RepID=UPI00300123D2